MDADDLLKLIKNRRTIRKYQDKPIPKKIIDKIIEAGRWGPSAENSQTWRFLIIEKEKVKNEFEEYLYNNITGRFLASIRLLMKSSLEVIRKAPVCILAYNNCSLSSKASRLGKNYEKVAFISEIESVSASIENMFLMAVSLGVGMCWFTFPLLLEKKINEFFGIDNWRLMAILTLGYPAEKGRTHDIISVKEVLRYINE